MAREADVLPPVAIAPPSPVGVEQLAHCFRLNGENAAVELDGIRSTSATGLHIALQSIGAGDGGKGGSPVLGDKAAIEIDPHGPRPGIVRGCDMI